MEVRGVSRWDATPIKNSSKVNFLKKIATCCAFVLLGASAYFSTAKAYDYLMDSTSVSANIPLELRASLDDVLAHSDARITESVALLSSRVKALEADNQRMSDELSDLLDHDGVIARLVTHIRALHAQSEATRRDVVDAMVGPMSGADPASDLQGVDPALPMEATESPFLSKAKHTIVTPAAAKVEVQEEASTKPKGKAKPVQAETDEGATN